MFKKIFVEIYLVFQDFFIFLHFIISRCDGKDLQMAGGVKNYNVLKIDSRHFRKTRVK